MGCPPFSFTLTVKGVCGLTTEGQLISGFSMVCGLDTVKGSTPYIRMGKWSVVSACGCMTLICTYAFGLIASVTLKRKLVIPSGCMRTLCMASTSVPFSMETKAVPVFSLGMVSSASSPTLYSFLSKEKESICTAEGLRESGLPRHDGQSTLNRNPEAWPPLVSLTKSRYLPHSG